MSCPSDNALVAYADGQLPGAERDVVELHLDQCPECAALLPEAAGGASEPTRVDGAGVPQTAALAGRNRGLGEALPRGSVLGRYIVLAEIGAGGLGRVYAAYDPELDRRVALKLLKDSADTEASKRLLREAQAMAKLSHPNVVPVYDFGVVDGRGFIAMSLVAGQTLRQWVRAGKREPLQIRDTFVMAGRGLSAAHAQGLVHRDFKPTNVLVDATGRAMVMDFGLATTPVSALSSLSGAGVDALQRPRVGMLDAPLTAAGIVMGTMGFMAPEQLLGHAVDARADQFSFCVSLYEALYGRRPFEIARGAQHYLDQIAACPRHDPGAVDRVPAWLRRVLARGLSFDPAARYASMDAILVALVADRRAKRRNNGLLGIAIAGLAAVIAVAVLLVRTVPSDTARSDIEVMVRDARLAASRAYFVYPPAGDPGFETAYRAVGRLEALEGGGARSGRAQARLLRHEFAATLARLGDEYWERPGGAGFAADYYAAALVFVPGHKRSVERLLLTPGQLASLRDKAAHGSFSPLELAAAEPLAALAEPDPERRRQRLRSLATNPKLPSSVARAIATSLRALGPAPPSQGSPAARPKALPRASDVGSPKAGAGTTGALASEPGGGEGETGGEGDTGLRSATVDPRPVLAQARAQVELGRAAIKANRMVAAERYFHRALGYDRRNAAALAGLSEVYFERGEYTRAVEFGERAVAQRGRRGRYRILLGDAYLRSLRYGAAREQYDVAKALSDPRAERRLAALSARVGGSSP